MRINKTESPIIQLYLQRCFLQSDPVGASVGVLNGSGDWFGETPLVPDFLAVADPPHVDLYLPSLLHIHWSLEEISN